MRRIIKPGVRIDLGIEGGPDYATVQSVTDRRAIMRWDSGGGVMVIGVDLLKRLAAAVRRGSA